MSRIAPAFARLRQEQRLGLITFVTVGYPALDSTPDLVEALVEAGSDMIELGIPFSDPLAEGRTVQRTTQQALRNGVTVEHCLRAAAECRRRVDVPLLFMGYINPVLAYGVEGFCHDAAQAGIDGLIIPDLAIEEAAELRAACVAENLDLILFLAPTSTEERIKHVAQLASGFIYCVSVTGVTGSRAALPQDINGWLAHLREETRTPLGLGFGISRPEHIELLRGKVDAAIVGSALLEAVVPEDPAGSAAQFVRGLMGQPV